MRLVVRRNAASGAAPAAASLLVGELALCTGDGNLFAKLADNSVLRIGGAHQTGSYVSLAGNETVGGTKTFSSNLQLSQAAGTNRLVGYQTGGVNRFTAGVTNAAESGGGSNSGSNYQIVRYNDAGTSLGVPLQIYRINGILSFADGTASISSTGVVNALYFVSGTGRVPGLLWSLTGTPFGGNNSTSYIDLSGGGGVGSTTLPVGFWYAGRTIRYRLAGRYSSSGGTGLYLTFWNGGVVMGQSYFAPPGVSNLVWTADFVVVCKGLGVSGALAGRGHSTWQTGQQAGLPVPVLPPWAGSPAGPVDAVTVDTTVANGLALTANFDNASSSNSIVCTNLTIEAMN